MLGGNVLFYFHEGCFFQLSRPRPHPAGKTQSERAKEKPVVETETEYRDLLLLRAEVSAGGVDNGSSRAAGKGGTYHEGQCGSLL